MRLHSLPLPHLAPVSKAALAVALATLGAGCGGGHSHHSHVPAPQGPPVYYELEPNDSPEFPDRIGPVDRLTHLFVDGFVQAIGFDIVDHIEFHSVYPAVYQFRVDALSPYGDVDVTVYDPVAGVVVGEYFFSGSYEVGEIVVHQADRPFQLIIEAYGYDTDWSLELVGYPYSGFNLTGGGSTVTATSSGLADEDAQQVEGATPRVSPIEARIVERDEMK